jgi:O-antigen biosynthesis protein
MKISIVIPAWKSKELLEKNLPFIIKTKPFEIIVVEDCSNDGTKEFLVKNYPEIKMVVHTTNLGFAKACNDGVSQASGEIVILLNSDVVPKENFLKSIDNDFKDSKIFGVSLHEEQWSWARGYWHKGFVEHEPGVKTLGYHDSFWASGGSAAFRKSVWVELNGFDDLYYPFYWEDIDISYRAWKRGYRIIWDPLAIVYHKHEGTIGKHFSKTKVDNISQRNQLLFIWKNITDSQMMKEHLKYLIIRLIKSPGFVKPLINALFKLPEAIRERKIEVTQGTVGDKEIFELFK